MTRFRYLPAERPACRQAGGFFCVLSELLITWQSAGGSHSDLWIDLDVLRGNRAIGIGLPKKFPLWYRQKCRQVKRIPI